MGTAGTTETDLSGKGLKLAIVVSRYNAKICDGLLQGALDELQRLEVAAEEVSVYRVPGAFELPFTAKILAETSRPDAILCLGAVIRGGTAHFDYVCQGATQGIQRAMLETGVPMAFGVLTTDNIEQAVARSSADENNKGREAAQTAVAMARLTQQLKP